MVRCFCIDKLFDHYSVTKAVLRLLAFPYSPTITILDKRISNITMVFAQ